MGREARALPGAVLIAAVLLWAAAGCLEAQSQGTDELAALRSRVSQLQREGKYAESMLIAERYVALAQQRHGANHPEFARGIGSLASVFHDYGRLAEAEPLFNRALTTPCERTVAVEGEADERRSAATRRD